jgi:pimeloyl-ACP methyl ester carboxylesterase
LAASLAVLAACTSSAPVRVDHLAAHLGFTREVRHGIGFDHVVYRNRLSGDAIHIYLEGDGSPWESPTKVSHDPTPRNPLMLRLMAQDQGPAAYVGRPCYHGLAGAPGCDPGWWTDRRYSPEVVASMGGVIHDLVAESRHTRTTLIGHSGGGTLAMLIAERLAMPCDVVTLAGNLDVAAWTERHGYSPLLGSLDPARRPPLPPSVTQLHLVGRDDTVIPPALVAAVAARQANARVVVLDGVAHRHGWEAIWPVTLDRLSATPLDAAPPPWIVPKPIMGDELCR